MNFSLGGVKRGFLVFAAVLLLSVTLSACSSEEKPSAPKPVATEDPKAADEAAVKDLTTRYWAAVVKAENAADPDPTQFKAVARGNFIEGQLNTLRTYKDGDIRRIGEPEITDVEVAVTGDSAKIKACLNENGWGAKHKGRKVPAPKSGPLPWGAKAERIDGDWLMVDVAVPEKGSKEC